MPTKRDQLQSYQFMVQRVVSALILRETDPLNPPFRRLVGSAFASIMIAALVLGVAGVIGLIFPGGSSAWKNGQSVIVVKETGAVFVYRAGVLYPVANITSAKLMTGAQTAAAGSGNPLGDAVSVPGQTVNVSENSLTDVPRGQMLGIPGAPDALPGKGNMSTQPWGLCSRLDVDSTGSAAPKSVLEIANATPSGNPLQDYALLVRESESGQLALVWHNYRYAITDQQAVLTGLGYQQTEPMAVSSAWLNALPAGAPLDPPKITGLGGPSTALPGARVGQVFQVQTQGADDYYVAMPDELQAITDVQASLLLASASTRTAYAGESVVAKGVSLSDAAAAKKGSPPVTGRGLPPASRPQLVSTSPTTAACASFAGGATAPEIRVGALSSVEAGSIPTSGRGAQGAAIADEIRVRPGWGALVESVATPGSPAGALSIVTDEGIRYPLAEESSGGGSLSGATQQPGAPPVRNFAVMNALGYSTSKPVKLPASLVSRLPVGPTLSIAAASKPAEKDNGDTPDGGAPPEPSEPPATGGPTAPPTGGSGPTPGASGSPRGGGDEEEPPSGGGSSPPTGGGGGGSPPTGGR